MYTHVQIERWCRGGAVAISKRNSGGSGKDALQIFMLQAPTRKSPKFMRL